ncbi:hypothetical protein BDM02DRAFT_2510324 [Thelephora ganbajun]|uniref:Uncharacterized protein n=1 Tax=Thelephora ganbajun TaxID=370292 RepID=A0ACB6ZF51_THEGA|nr:hypothetical protein BDM02DRAFT_2510324 [Thelephora ganbajun]
MMKLSTTLLEGDLLSHAQNIRGSSADLPLRTYSRLVSFISHVVFTGIYFQRRVREHMATLIPERDWLQDVIHPDELQAWDPQTGPCCTSAAFKLNLRGTPLDDWNVSASRVFTNHFLATHSDSYYDTWENRETVLHRSQTYIKTLIKLYRQKFIGSDVAHQNKLAQRQRARKTALYHRRRDLTFAYRQMEPQRRMLEDLGVDGMSSDEEVKTRDGIQYLILVPKWRAPVLTPWLRVFDSLYLRHRNQDEHGDQRGCLPRRRGASTKESSSRKFVPGLPINAYRADWLEQQLDIANIVHPTAPQLYTHDPALAQLALNPYH